MKARFPRSLGVLPVAAAALLAACGSSANTTGSVTGSVTATGSVSSSSTSNASSLGIGGIAGGGTQSTASTPCATAQFGSAMQPKDAPADVHTYASAPAMQIDTAKLYQATITTARGNIVLCLQPKLAPKTVNNFVVLARNHFYDGISFHRVVAGFVIQGGDPRGTGSGGPGYAFADEPVQGSYTSGCVAMANAGPNTNGSQFFICTADDTRLAKQYNLFGQVSKGLDVALKIQQGDRMTSVTVQEQS